MEEEEKTDAQCTSGRKNRESKWLAPLVEGAPLTTTHVQVRSSSPRGVRKASRTPHQGGEVLELPQLTGVGRVGDRTSGQQAACPLGTGWEERQGTAGDGKTAQDEVAGQLMVKPGTPHYSKSGWRKLSTKRPLLIDCVVASVTLHFPAVCAFRGHHAQVAPSMDSLGTSGRGPMSSPSQCGTENSLRTR